MLSKRFIQTGHRCQAAVAFCLTWMCVTSVLAQAPAPERHTIMHLTTKQMDQMMADHLNAPTTKSMDVSAAAASLPATFSLLSLLPYIPSERNQGQCGDCWAWAGTGVVEIAHNVQNGVADRLSVQFLNSCNPYVTCCDGGTLANVAQFYTYEGFALPWTNSNAAWTSGDGNCSTTCGSIGTAPQYPITSASVTTITTSGVSQAQAIANIKAALNQNKAIWFGFFMGSDADWNNFDSFWGNYPESKQWNSFNPGEAMTTGGGHAIVCVGYDDTDPAGPTWIMVNSWGTTSQRPNGIVHVSQNINYSGTFTSGGSSYQQLFWETINIQFVSQANYTLTINVNGTGSVQTGGSNAPSTITVPAGQAVNLTAQGNFVAWSGCQNSASNAVQIAMTTNLTVTANFQDGSTPLAPVIVTQPVSQNIAEGGNLSLSVTGYGLPTPAFSWSAGGQPVGTGATLTLTNVTTSNSGNYSCVLSNTAGQIQSTSATVNVEAPPAFAQQPVSELVAAGATATFSAVANSTNVTYQWYKSSSPLAGRTKASLVISNCQASDAASYFLVISNALLAASATSSVVTLTEVSRPAISIQPAGTNVVLGSNATLSVTASGGSLFYNWKRGTNCVQTGTNNTCPVNSSIPGTVNYTVVVTNLAGTVTSSAAAVMVIASPTVASMPTNKNLDVGSNCDHCRRLHESCGNLFLVLQCHQCPLFDEQQLLPHQRHHQ